MSKEDLSQGICIKYLQANTNSPRSTPKEIGDFALCANKDLMAGIDVLTGNLKFPKFFEI